MVFWAPCGSGEGAGGWRCLGISWGMGGVPLHTHAHARTHTHAHVYMYRNCKWPLTWRHPCLACLICMCVCVHACACMHAWDTPTHAYPPPPHTPIHHPPRGWTPRISKNLITLELIKIFEFHLKI